MRPRVTLSVAQSAESTERFLDPRQRLTRRPFAPATPQAIVEALTHTVKKLARTPAADPAAAAGTPPDPPSADVDAARFAQELENEVLREELEQYKRAVADGEQQLRAAQAEAATAVKAAREEAERELSREARGGPSSAPAFLLDPEGACLRSALRCGGRLWGRTDGQSPAFPPPLRCTSDRVAPPAAGRHRRRAGGRGGAPPLPGGAGRRGRRGPEGRTRGP